MSMKVKKLIICGISSDLIIFDTPFFKTKLTIYMIIQVQKSPVTAPSDVDSIAFSMPVFLR